MAVISGQTRILSSFTRADVTVSDKSYTFDKKGLSRYKPTSRFYVIWITLEESFKTALFIFFQ